MPVRRFVVGSAVLGAWIMDLFSMSFAGRLGVVSKESKLLNSDRMGTQTSTGDSVDARGARATRPSENTRAPRPLSVRIGGQNLSIRTTHDANFVESLAGHIDQKVAELQKMAPSASLSKLLMLASMTVARSEERRVGKECRSRW